MADQEPNSADDPQTPDGFPTTEDLQQKGQDVFEPDSTSSHEPERTTARLAKINHLAPKPKGIVTKPVSPCEEPLLQVLVIRHGIGIYDERWLDYRYGLLSAITAPSLKAQSSNRYHILVQVDELVDDQYLQKVSRLFDWSDRFYIQKLQFHADRRRALRDFCQRLSGENTTHVLTSRIDDDDGLSQSALHEIETAAQSAIDWGRKSAAIFVRHGTLFIAAHNQSQQILDDSRSVAASVLFRAGISKNIYFSAHRDIPARFNTDNSPTLYIEEDKGSFLYTVHKMSNMDYYSRLERARSNNAFSETSENVLRSYGVDFDALSTWREREMDYPGLGSVKTTDTLKALDKQIVAERDRAAKSGAVVYSDELKSLMREKVSYGSDIVDRLKA